MVCDRKIAGLKLCQAYRRQYGVDYISGDANQSLRSRGQFPSRIRHVIPALMRKAHEAKQAGRKTLQVWGSGKPMREFLYVDDAADALVSLLKTYSGEAMSM